MKTFTNRSNARRSAIAAIAKAENLTKNEVKERADELFTVEFADEDDKVVFTWRRVSTTMGGMRADVVIVDDVIETVEDMVAEVEEVFESNEDLETKLEAALDLSDKINEPVIGDFTYCPHCKTHLGNGVIDNLQHFEDQPRNLRNYPNDVKEFLKGMVEGTTHEFNCMACGKDFGEPLTLEMPKGKLSFTTGTGVKIEKDREERNGIRRPSVGSICARIWEACDDFYDNNNAFPKPKELEDWAECNDISLCTCKVQLYVWRNFKK